MNGSVSARRPVTRRHWHIRASSCANVPTASSPAKLTMRAARTDGFDLSPVILDLASVSLGTAVIQPGRFNPIGTWIGIYFLTTGITGLEQLGLQTWGSNVVYGGVLGI